MQLRVFLLTACLVAAAAWGQAMTPTRTAPPAVDARHAPPRDVNTTTHPLPWGSAAAWQARRAELREQVLVAAGLWPETERPPLQPTFVGPPILRDGYSIERVWFETRPGVVLGGNLYRPYPLVPGRQYPAVLTPHGHAERGRLASDDQFDAPGRCINLARFGFVVFTYDMVGYNDTGLGLTHRNFALGQTVPALYGIGVFGLQTYNSLRGLDFLSSLPEVDPARIGVTGESGGGTQTFIVCAVDDRPAVAAPVNMISLHMAGGCVCENSPGLRVDSDNVQISALHSPKPQLMVAATGDWTTNTVTVEGPYAKEAWGLQGAADQLEWVIYDAPHNYNLDSRQAVYAFFGRHLLGNPNAADFREQPFLIEPDEDLLVFPNHQPPPRQADEATIIARWRELAQPDFGRLAELGIGLRHALAVEPVAPSAALISGTAPHLVLGRDGTGERVEATWQPPGQPGAAAVVLLGQDADLARSLAASGRGVLSVAPFTYEPARDRYEQFYTCYNRTDLACRVQDALTAVAALRASGYRRVELVGTGREAAVAVLAGAWADIDGLAADLGGLDVTSDEAYLEDLWQPGLRAMGDVRTAALLAAQRCDVQLSGVRGWSAAWAADHLVTSSASVAQSQVIEALSAARRHQVTGDK